MAELSTLARPYARAAFEYADTTGNVDSWAAMLNLAAALLAEEKVVELVGSPTLPSQTIAAQFIGLLGDEAGEPGQNFISTLATNKRLALLPEIATQFNQFKAQREKSVDVTITSAFDLTDETATKLETALAANLERQVRLTTETDKSLLGGVVIRAGDTIIDGSVRGRLAKLAESMNS